MSHIAGNISGLAVRIIISAFCTKYVSDGVSLHLSFQNTLSNLAFRMDCTLMTGNLFRLHRKVLFWQLCLSLAFFY